MRTEETVKFGKKDLINRIVITNYFRILIGGFFFVELNVLYLMRTFLSPGGEALIFIGIYLLLYALLTFYYLKTNKNVIFGELVFLSIFIAVLDTLFTTSMIYFSGGGESTLFALYFFNILAVAVMFPYYLRALFWSAAINSILYISLVLSLIYNLIPYYPRLPLVYAAKPEMLTISISNIFGVPGLLFFFAIASHMFSAQMIEQKAKMDKLEDKSGIESKENKAMYKISWLLCKILTPREMLQDILGEICEMVNVKSAAIYIVIEHGSKYEKAASVDEPPLLENYMSQLSSGKIPSAEDAEFKQVLGSDGHPKPFLIPLIAPPGKFKGLLLLFSKTREAVDLQGIELLDSIGREIAITLSYSEMLSFKKKKPSTERTPKRA